MYSLIDRVALKIPFSNHYDFFQIKEKYSFSSLKCFLHDTNFKYRRASIRLTPAFPILHCTHLIGIFCFLNNIIQALAHLQAFLLSHSLPLYVKTSPLFVIYLSDIMFYPIHPHFSYKLMLNRFLSTTAMYLLP